MSIRDPLKWMKEHQPGDIYDIVNLGIANPVYREAVAIVDTFTKDKARSYNAVIDWLEKSPVYVWPYAEIEHHPNNLREVTLTLSIDCAVVDALDVSGNTTGTSYWLARTAARTLNKLSQHVYDNTKNTIFINEPK